VLTSVTYPFGEDLVGTDVSAFCWADPLRLELDLSRTGVCRPDVRADLGPSKALGVPCSLLEELVSFY
jgi:hypothetical protein